MTTSHSVGDGMIVQGSSVYFGAETDLRTLRYLKRPLRSIIISRSQGSSLIRHVVRTDALRYTPAM
jgi:hypothetical protein